MVINYNYISQEEDQQEQDDHYIWHIDLDLMQVFHYAEIDKKYAIRWNEERHVLECFFDNRWCKCIDQLTKQYIRLINYEIEKALLL